MARPEVGVAESDYDYDVALSFAGEDRDYVDKVAKMLHALGVRVFYDKIRNDRSVGQGSLRAPRRRLQETVEVLRDIYLGCLR
jgi:hypothetical protein